MIYICMGTASGGGVLLEIAPDGICCNSRNIRSWTKPFQELVKKWVVEVCVNGFGGKLNIAGVKW